MEVWNAVASFERCANACQSGRVSTDCAEYHHRLDQLISGAPPDRTTISAQKVVDAFHQPDIPISSNFHEKRVTAGPMHGYSLAELKLKTAGTPSTFASANYYNLKAKQRRDELLAKFNEEKEQ